MTLKNLTKKSSSQNDTKFENLTEHLLFTKFEVKLILRCLSNVIMFSKITKNDEIYTLTVDILLKLK